MEGIVFEELEDSRQDWKVKHSLTEILTVVMCSVSAGEMSVYGICAFAKIKELLLKEVVGLELPHGLPSYDTVRRTLGVLDPVQFQSVFIQYPVIERNTAENLAIIRRIVYNRIKMLSDLDTLSMGKRPCIYDDSFRAKILFSC